MNRNDYLKLFDGTRDQYVLAAIQSREAVRPVPRKNRILLIAAVVATALLLMGCVAAFLGLQQRKIGELPVTQKFDTYGQPVSEPEKTWYIASMSGYGSSPARQASQQWNEFQRTYQPETLTNQTDNPAIPNAYEYTYHCFDQVMVDKLTEIAETYGLNLLGTRAVAQAWHQELALETLGISWLVCADAPAEAGYGACRIYPPCNFVWDLRLTLTGADAPWTEEVYCEYHYFQSGYLAPDDALYYDPETTQEWEYTAPDGTSLLLALSETDGIILAQRQDSTIVIRLDLAWQQGPFLDADTPLPTQAALEALADCFDYAVLPQSVPMDGLQEVFDAIPDPSSVPPEDLPLPPQHTSYAAYLNENCLWPEFMEYAFHDIDGDGEEDLILSRGNGICVNWLGLRDGQVCDLTGGRGEMRLCEDGIVQLRDPSWEQHLYMKILGPAPMAGVELEMLHSVSYSAGQWKIDEDSCTAQEAADFMAQFKPLPLNWQPLTNFSMDDQGTTFAELLAQENSPTGEDLHRFYAAHYHTDWGWDYSYFQLQDINSDGIPDLLLSHDGALVEAAYTCKRGQLFSLDSSFYLCADNVLHSIRQIDRYNIGILEHHQFRRHTGGYSDFHYRLSHNLSTGVWTDTNFSDISQEEAQAILAKYPQVPMNMHPIQDLLSTR